MRNVATVILALACVGAPTAWAQNTVEGMLSSASTMGASAWVAAGTAAPSIPEPAFEGPALDGTWGQVFVTTTETRVPVLGTIRSVTTALLVMEVTQDQDWVQISRSVCAIDVDSGTAVVNTTIPAAFVRAIPESRSTVQLVERDAEWTLSGWSLTEVVGMALDQPSTEMLPTSADDPRVTDADGDGHPGVTVQVRGIVRGEVYVAQRGISTLSTTVVDENTIDGQVNWSAQQVVLGASNRMLLGENDARPSSRGNYFSSRRVTDGMGCTELRSRSEELLGVSF
jgi:hypothetical protein